MARAADGARRSGEATLTRLVRAWHVLSAERRLAAYAAFGLFLTMFLPWYQQNIARGRTVVPHDVSAFGTFSFVEAAVLLVAAGVLALLFARAERRDFHLPGGDGTVIMGAGLWAALLLVWRLFDKPAAAAGGVNVGIEWGIFFALTAAGLLAYAGSRMRATRRPEPPLVEPDEPVWVQPGPPGTTRTRVLPPERPPAEPPTEPTMRTEEPPRRTRRRPPPPAAFGDQLTMPLGSEPPLGDDER